MAKCNVISKAYCDSHSYIPMVFWLHTSAQSLACTESHQNVKSAYKDSIYSHDLHQIWTFGNLVYHHQVLSFQIPLSNKRLYWYNILTIFFCFLTQMQNANHQDWGTISVSNTPHMIDLDFQTLHPSCSALFSNCTWRKFGLSCYDCGGE